MAVPYNSDGDRINMLRVYLSTVRDIAGAGASTPRTLENLHKQVVRQLEADTDRAAAMGVPFMSMVTALANPDFQKWADQLLERRAHTLAAATNFHWTTDARQMVRELLIEAIAIGATKFDALGSEKQSSAV